MAENMDNAGDNIYGVARQVSLEGDSRADGRLASEYTRSVMDPPMMAHTAIKEV